MLVKNKLNKALVFSSMLSLLMGVVACNDGGESPDSPQINQGFYRAKLKALNSPVVVSTGGALEGAESEVGIAIVDDEVLIAEEATGFQDADHRQAIYLGTECPTQADDTNQDGILDWKEGQLKYLDMLVPLDGDIDSQIGGAADVPSGENFIYKQTGSLEKLLDDLRQADEDPEDGVTKLAANEQLNLAGKVIVVHGVPDSTSLPETTQGQGTYSAAASLPVACGVIERLDSDGGTGGSSGGTSGSN